MRPPMMANTRYLIFTDGAHHSTVNLLDSSVGDLLGMGQGSVGGK